MHSLNPEHKCITNSFELKNRINIITGSNMSGKTSFLRVMGMNLVLMNLGCKINGQSFKANDFKIFSSMRIKDDFINGVSSFYSELLNIKKAIDYQKTNNNMIIFIDEIFRGTNSNDRINGAISLIKQLNKENVILFLTTHDFELCDINLDNIDNFHFEEHYENDKILFDYKIKNGKCNTTNAKYLMKMVGIEE
jgi:DNA mismatch repair ATPase MutS